MPTRRRWLWIIPPIVCIGIIEALSDSILDPLLPFPRDTILVLAVVAVLIVVGAVAAFRAIDRLSEALRRRNAELEAKNERAAALHRVTVAVAALGNLDRILDTIVANARQLLSTDVGVLVLIRADGEPRLRAADGPPGAFVHDGTLGGDEVARFVRRELLAVRLSAPLRRGGQVDGQLAVGSAVARAFSVDDVEMLSSLANQAAIAIENARLQAELREREVVVERERIAREMHDGLAQVLGYVNTKSQAVEELLAGGRTEEARGQMAELAAAARSIYVDVREAILGLSSPIIPGRGLVGSLEGYLPRFAEQAKLVVKLEPPADLATIELEPASQAQVFRIVQEALTNVRKHAAARRVWVRLYPRDAGMVVEVEDDGRGFDPADAETAGWPHFGLTAMRERAAAVGGRIDWEVRPGAGTLLRLSVPLDGTSMVDPLSQQGPEARNIDHDAAGASGDGAPAADATDAAESAEVRP